MQPRRYQFRRRRGCLVLHWVCSAGFAGEPWHGFGLKSRTSHQDQELYSAVGGLPTVKPRFAPGVIDPTNRIKKEKAPSRAGAHSSTTSNKPRTGALNRSLKGVGQMKYLTNRHSISNVGATVNQPAGSAQAFVVVDLDGTNATTGIRNLDIGEDCLRRGV